MNVRVALALGLCAGFPLPQEPPLSSAERQVIQAWLTCHDCRAGEREAVVALAARKPAGTIVLLRNILLVDADSAARAAESLLVRRDLLRDARDAGIMGLQPASVSIDRVAGNVVTRSARLQAIRAAGALGWIDTPAARAALEAALRQRTDPRLLRWIRFALDTLPLRAR